MPIDSLSLAVVGADYPNKKGPSRRFEIALCEPGEAVALVREPRNPADPRAVAVFTKRGVQIGYLSAERCGWIGRMIEEDRPIDAVFQAATPYGAIIRVAFDGNAPVLPASTSQLADAKDNDFWPDPEWPD